jgi:hypothetical protein
MTKQQAKKLKRKLLGLRWDINMKSAKLERLARLLVEKAHEHSQFTKSDYRGFFESRRIRQTWL